MTINEAIFKVCTTKFKKDALDAHKALNAIGLQTFKTGGQYAVYNPATRKRVTVDVREEYGYGRGYYKVYVVYGDYTFKVRRERLKFDFMGYLTKPVNEAYRELYNIPKKPTLKKFDTVRSARLYLEWRKDEVAKIQAQMDKLQKDLISAVRRQVEYENNLAKARADLGLKRR